VIIGAGFTGAVLAERFASRGKKILVIERRRIVADKFIFIGQRQCLSKKFWGR